MHQDAITFKKLATKQFFFSRSNSNANSNDEILITLDVDTTSTDIDNQIQALPLSRRDKILHTLKILSAPTRGMGSVYATFGSIAMLYKKNGLWLIAPVSLGGLIALTDSFVDLLLAKYPNNEWFSKSHQVFKIANGGVVGYLADYGFTWGLIKSIALVVTDNQKAIKDTVLIAGPIISFIPALLIRYSRYKQLNGTPMDKGLTAFTADLMRGLTAPVGLLGTLSLQGVIPLDSYIPLAIMSLGGIMMSVSYATSERIPLASKLLKLAVNLLMENPSLAAMFFAFPNDIYASVNDGLISEEFFYSNMAISTLFLVIMTCLSLGMAFSKPNELDEEELIVDVPYIERENNRFCF